MVISMRLKFVFLASCTTEYVIIWELLFFFLLQYKMKLRWEAGLLTYK